MIRTSGYQIRYAYADRPYVNWSTPGTLADDSGDLAFDAVMDCAGNVHVFYIEQGTNFIVTRRMTFSMGEWTVGSKVYVCNDGVALAPSVALDAAGTLWVSWSRLSGGSYDVQVKTSDDGGASWGSGPGDTGETIESGMPVVRSRIGVSSSHVFVVYTGTDVSARWRPLSGGSWTAKYTVASGTGIDEHFDAAVSTDGLLGIVFDCGQLRYREYDGSNWSALATLDEEEGDHPQLFFVKNVPVVSYLNTQSATQAQIRFVERSAGVFSPPAVLDNRAGVFDGVVLFDAVSGSYAELTAAASSEDTADVYHPMSGVMLKNVGDCVYLGMDLPFRFVTFALSTSGTGGTTGYSYWDGSNWKGFSPAGEMFHLDALEAMVALWDDYSSISADWQQVAVDGTVKYWLRIEVTSDFATGPIGSRITAISGITALAVRR